jgi:hypothetical protein
MPLKYNKMNEKDLKRIDIFLALGSTVTGIMTMLYVFPLYFPGRLWIFFVFTNIIHRAYFRRR